MTTATEIERILIDGHDEDGKPESFEVTITGEANGYKISVFQDGDFIDGYVCGSLTMAQDIMSDRADDIRKEDKEIARKRIEAAKTYGRELLMGAAAEMTGEDKDAAQLLALLVGAGRGPAALAALRRIALK